MKMIEVNNLGFTYPGAKERTIKDVSFSIERGEIFGFLGPSGAGKTTTQKILIGLFKRYGGEVSILDRNLKDWKTDLYEKIGVSFELPNHYGKLTAIENLNFFRSLYSRTTESSEKLLEMVGLQKDADTRVMHYSKGMKMRLNFVKSLINRSEILFLDEPTMGMDPANARMIKDIILEKKSEGKTIFLTTHDMTVVGELCDKVAFIVDGRIVLIDSPKELKIKRGRRMVRVEYLMDYRIKAAEFPLDNLGENLEFLKLIRNRKIATIHTMEATLEDV
ncbi:MAG: ABC transporter ATP-binding protein, partial [Candidatus Methanofastidiosia archaeon]